MTLLLLFFVMLIAINDHSLYPLIRYDRTHIHIFVIMYLEEYTKILSDYLSVV